MQINSKIYRKVSWSLQDQQDISHLYRTNLQFPGINITILYTDACEKQLLWLLCMLHISNTKNAEYKLDQRWPIHTIYNNTIIKTYIAHSHRLYSNLRCRQSPGWQKGGYTLRVVREVRCVFSRHNDWLPVWNKYCCIMPQHFPKDYFWGPAKAVVTSEEGAS